MSATNRTEDLNVKVSEGASDCAISNTSDRGQAGRIGRPQGEGTKWRARFQASPCRCDAEVASRCDDRRDDEGNRLAAHSVRGFLAGVVRKRLRLKLGSKKVDGERIYQITGGEKAKSKSRSQSKRRSS
jgi:Protein of unknown function (DUF3489)